MSKILSVATAGLVDGQLLDVNHLRFPRIDYIELHNLLGAETLDYAAYDRKYIGNIFRNLETFLRSDIYLAFLAWMKSSGFNTVFTWSERAGIPYAVFHKYLKPRARFVTMFQCWSERQELAITKLNLFSAMDHIIVHCSSMQQNLIRLGAPADRVSLIHYSVDQNFFSPVKTIQPEKNMIMSIGEPRSRDYPSLFEAVKTLPVNLVLPAYGHWYAREKKKSIGTGIPQNVCLIRHQSQVELKELYARSQFVVLPVRDLVYSAGATASLEAGCMARAVVAFRSRGITDYIIDGETGILVEPGNTEALREAIRFLLENPQEAERLGQNARQRIVDTLHLENYVGRIAALLRESRG